MPFWEALNERGIVLKGCEFKKKYMTEAYETLRAACSVLATIPRDARTMCHKIALADPDLAGHAEFGTFGRRRGREQFAKGATQARSHRIISSNGRRLFNPVELPALLDRVSVSLSLSFRKS